MSQGNHQQDFRIQDSGERRSFSTGSVRDVSEGKGTPALMPVLALIRLSKHYEGGKQKYGSRNWELGQPVSQYFESGYRHLLKALGGGADEDHLAACAWNVLAIIETRERIKKGLADAELDDLAGYNLFPDIDPNPSDTPDKDLNEYLMSLKESEEAEQSAADAGHDHFHHSQ